MHEGHCCSELGVPGWPALAEELMVHRDIELAKLTGARIHLLHLSTAGSVVLVRQAKADGVRSPPRCPTPPQPHRRVVPRLRPGVQGQPTAAHEGRHRCAGEGVVDGTIDAIATDHAPHPAADKERPLDEAPPGMVGLETAFGVCLPVLRAGMALGDVLAAMSWRPAAIAGVADRHGRPVATGSPGNLVVFDPAAAWEVVPASWAVAATTRRSSAGSCVEGSATPSSGIATVVATGWQSVNEHTLRAHEHAPGSVASVLGRIGASCSVPRTDMSAWATRILG